MRRFALYNSLTPPQNSKALDDDAKTTTSGKGKGGSNGKDGGGTKSGPPELGAKQAKAKRKAERAAMEAARREEVDKMMKVM